VSPSPLCPPSRHIAIGPRHHPLACSTSLSHIVFGSRLSQRGGWRSTFADGNTAAPLCLPVFLSLSLRVVVSRGHGSREAPLSWVWLKKEASAPPFCFFFFGFLLCSIATTTQFLTQIHQHSIYAGLKRPKTDVLIKFGK